MLGNHRHWAAREKASFNVTQGLGFFLVWIVNSEAIFVISYSFSSDVMVQSKYSDLVKIYTFFGLILTKKNKYYE